MMASTSTSTSTQRGLTFGGGGGGPATPSPSPSTPLARPNTSFGYGTPPRVTTPTSTSPRSPLADAAETGKLWRDYQTLVRSKTLTADDVAAAWTNGAALAAVVALWIGLRLAGTLQFLILNYLLALLAIVFTSNLVPPLIKAQRSSGTAGTTDLPDFRTWVTAQKSRLKALGPVSTTGTTGMGTPLIAGAADPSRPPASPTVPGSPMDIDAPRMMAPLRMPLSPPPAGQLLIVPVPPIASSLTSGGVPGQSSSSGSTTTSTASAVSAAMTVVPSEPLFSPIAPMSNYLLRMGTNNEPVRDARALERVIQQAATSTPDSTSYTRSHPIMFSPPSATVTPSSLPPSAASPAGPFGGNNASPMASPPSVSIYPAVPLPPMTSPTPSLFAHHPQSPTPMGGSNAGGLVGRSNTPPSPVMQYHVASVSSSDSAARELASRSDVTDESIERMRRWLSAQIFEPLAAAIKEVDSALEAEGLPHLTTRGAFLSYPAMDLLAVVDVKKGGLKELSPNAPPPPPPAPAPTLGLFGAKPTTTSSFGFGGVGAFGAAATATPAQQPKPQTLGNLLYARPHDPLVRKRLLLEMYLTLPPNVSEVYPRSSRDYIVARVQELAMGGMLAAYRWDSGGSLNGEAWSKQRPTDAELVVHCFLTFMDIITQMSGISVSNLTPFTSKYFVPFEGKPDPSRSIQIRQVSRSPPHYNLVLRGIPLDVAGKRPNVFATLAFFVQQVAKESAGYLGLLHLGAPEIGLAAVEPSLRSG